MLISLAGQRVKLAAQAYCHGFFSAQQCLCPKDKLDHFHGLQDKVFVLLVGFVWREICDKWTHRRARMFQLELFFLVHVAHVSLGTKQQILFLFFLFLFLWFSHASIPFVKLFGFPPVIIFGFPPISPIANDDRMLTADLS